MEMVPKKSEASKGLIRGHLSIALLLLETSKIVWFVHSDNSIRAVPTTADGVLSARVTEESAQETSNDM